MFLHLTWGIRCSVRRLAAAIPGTARGSCPALPQPPSRHLDRHTRAVAMVGAAYARFVRSHAKSVQAVEALLYHATWLLPGRFSASQLPLEAVNTALGLMAVIHEHILQQRTPRSRWPLLLACVQQVGLAVPEGARSLRQAPDDGANRWRSCSRCVRATPPPGAGPTSTARSRRWSSSSAPALPCRADPGGALRSPPRATGWPCERRSCWRAAQACCSSAGAPWSRAWRPHTRSACNAPWRCGAGPAACDAVAWSLTRGVQNMAAHGQRHVCDAGAAEVGCSAAYSSPRAAADGLSSSSRFSEQSAILAACPALWWQQERCSHHDGGASYASTSARTADRDRARSADSPACERARLARERLGKRLLATGEVLLLLRPLLYVLLLRRFGRKAWLPWAVAALVELLSRAASLRGASVMQQARFAVCESRQAHSDGRDIGCSAAVPGGRGRRISSEQRSVAGLAAALAAAPGAGARTVAAQGVAAVLPAARPVLRPPLCVRLTRA